MSYTYQWERCDPAGAGCVDIPGATSATYLLAPADVGGKIRVRVSDGVNVVTSPAVGPVGAGQPVVVGSLLFSEDFSGPLDLSKWDVKNRSAPSGTVFDSSHYSIHDGMLDIWADLVSGVWHSAEIQSLAPTYQYTGKRYMEARAKFPAGYGTWPAPIWEYDAPFGSLGIENDVCEQLGREPAIYHATVHNGPSEQSSHSLPAGVTLAGGDWHTYGCAMYADHADYYFDGALVLTIPAAALSAWHFTTQQMVVLVDLDMGGWGGTPTVAPPVHMYVDYVKIWQIP